MLTYWFGRLTSLPPTLCSLFLVDFLEVARHSVHSYMSVSLVRL